LKREKGEANETNNCQGAFLGQRGVDNRYDFDGAG
jgi:hypothetical protein